MPTITETPVRLWAFCPDATCPGYETREVDGIAREISRTAFEEAGAGTINGNSVSTSFMQYFVPSGDTDEHGHSTAAELKCEDCGRDVQVSSQPRPEYANVSGQDPNTLLMRRKDAERSRVQSDELAELRGMVNGLTAALAAQGKAEGKAA